MRLSLDIDNYHHEIDSTDPEILGKWVVEMFGRVGPGWFPATYITVRAQPSWLPQQPDGQPQYDWIADSRIMGQSTQIRSPRELVAALSAQIDEWEKLNGQDATGT